MSLLLHCCTPQVYDELMSSPECLSYFVTLLHGDLVDSGLLLQKGTGMSASAASAYDTELAVFCHYHTVGGCTSEQDTQWSSNAHHHYLCTYMAADEGHRVAIAAPCEREHTYIVANAICNSNKPAVTSI